METILKIWDFREFQRKEIPFLCEIWNWEGDETVLPGKWATIVNDWYGTEFKSTLIKKDYVENEKFDK